MEEGKERQDSGQNTNTEREEIFSKAVRAGKRTYFFDVKATRRNDYYLTITESKKRYNKDGRFFYEKHKIFLYKEDFEKFVEGLVESVDFIKEANPVEIPREDSPAATDDSKSKSTDYTNVEFEDLENVEVSAETETAED